MKIQKSQKKLMLNKTTIATMEQNQMNHIQGGTLPTEMCSLWKCKPTDDCTWGCDTYEPVC